MVNLIDLRIFMFLTFIFKDGMAVTFKGRLQGGTFLQTTGAVLQVNILVEDHLFSV